MYPEEPNVALIQEVVKKISFGHFPMPLEIKVRGQVLHIRITSQDRDNGNPAVIDAHHPIPSWFQRPHHFEAICDWIIEKVMDLLHHELLEFMSYDGRRLFDPHKPRTKPMLMTPQEVVDDMLKGMAFFAGKKGGQEPKL